MRVCSVHGCAEIYPTSEGSRCSGCRKAADKGRGTATQRGYTGAGHRTFRNAVLTRDPICVECGLRQSTVADHYPVSKRDLIAQGLNSNDPERGRGLCKPCHDVSTAREQPGGWAATQRA